MRYRITLTHTALGQAIDRLIAGSEHWVIGHAGLCRNNDATEVICSRLSTAPQPPERGALFVATLDAGRNGTDVTSLLRRLARHEPLALIRIGWGERRGTLDAHLITASGREVPVDELRIPGPGMHALRFFEAAQPSVRLDHASRERWSRQLGALGEDVFTRLSELRYALIGCGRGNSQVAALLARSGRERLTLIDPDHIEAHNLDMAGIGESDIGRPKVVAVAAALAHTVEDARQLHTCVADISSFAGLAAARNADVLICWADNDGARRTAGLIASFYARPLLDIGTGVSGAGRQRRFGIDVRLVLPGEACLECFGGLADPQEAANVFDPYAQESKIPWHAQRAGSQVSGNALAASLAIPLLEELAAERVTTSTWLRLEIGTSGIPSIRQLRPHPVAHCPVCERAGQAEAVADRAQVRMLGAALTRKPA